MRFLSLLLAFLLLAASCFAQQSVPKLHEKIYDPSADAKLEIANALKDAAPSHKRVILVFGGDWCIDCQVLNYRFHEAPNAQIIAENYIVVHVDIGHMDKNVDLADKYGVPLSKGVPGLAVVESNGTLLYSMKNGEFESARNLDPKQITAFLEKYKAH